MEWKSTLPVLPATHKNFLSYLSQHEKKPTVELLQPYREYDAKVRELYAQEPGAVKDPYANVVPVFAGPALKTRARKIKEETKEEKEAYLIPLSKEERRADGSPATVESLKDFKHNFNVFTELALSDLDWSNVVVAGSAALTPLLPLPEKAKESKRALRQYYHEDFTPASDVDLFLYGLTEDQAKEKIKQIEAKVRDSILQEVTCIRTKNAITIASQYPTRHIQIVLRIYKSISEILTGFDVDCSCVAFDGENVWAAPRALQALMTQVNHIDLSRRSPSYENRLSKYSHRGFEIYWPQLDRSRVDPTIFERSFGRTLGLARLLVLEKLPSSTERDQYANMRRKERGRPEMNLWRRNLHKLKGNIKNDHEDEVADWWLDQEEVSDYHTFTIPYGPKFNAKQIEKLLYTKDLLLNAEWNRKKDREVNLHRHPAFFGFAEDVFVDCCQQCPTPVTDEDLEVAELEDKIYVKGEISFMKDDPGRQQIGSFNPITDFDWTEMAYVGNTARLCAAIIDGDLEHVQDWLAQDDADPNQRDHVGRTPLQLAVQCSTPEIVRALVKANARLIARMANGYTALHLAAQRGNAEIIKIIMERSERNEAEHEERDIIKKEERKKMQQIDGAQTSPDRKAEVNTEQDDDHSDEDDEMDEDWDSENGESTSIATGSFVKVKDDAEKVEALPDDENADEPDFYDPNVLAWDTACSPLHLAILNGHNQAVEVLVGTFGADVLLPIKLLNDWDKSPRAAILTLVLALALPQDKAKEMTKTLLDLHASSSQADLKGTTALQYFANDGAEALDFLLEHDTAAARAALQHVAVTGNSWNMQTNSALLTAIANSDPITCFKILENGVAPDITFSPWIKQAKTILNDKPRFGNRNQDPDQMNKLFQKSVEQPLVAAINNDVINVAMALLKAGADANTLPKASAEALANNYSYRPAQSILDLVRDKLHKMKEYDGEKNEDLPPLPMKSDSEYLEGLEAGSYKHWVASTSVKDAKERYTKELEAYEERVGIFKNRKGLLEKRDAIEKAVSEYSELEEELLKRGAKTFKELHPDFQQQGNRFHSYQPYKPIRTPFGVNFSFRIGELNDQLKALYLELFKASWRGDLDTIKKLTLLPQGENKDQPPLKIAVQDYEGASPFSIAVMKGNLELAQAILEICVVQYSPEDEKEDAQYTMNRPQDDDEYSDSDMSDDDDDGIQVFKQLIQDKFTIDNIGEVSIKVESHVTPLKFLEWDCPVQKFSDGGVIKTSSSTRSLLTHAIQTNDYELLVWLLEMGHRYSTIKSENGIRPVGTFYNIASGYLQTAIELGRTRMIAELLKRNGCGIPFEDLVKKSGVKSEEKPKFYQGLSVYGKKRADWAQAGRQMHVETTSGSQISPPLMAAKLGSLESLEYLLSDTPLRLYLEFVNANKDDKRVKRLSRAKEGLEKTISDWYLANQDCLITCAVVGNPSDDARRRLNYLINAYPRHMDAKSTSGETPLQLAFKLGRPSFAKILLDSGADSMARDKAADNLIHKVLQNYNPLHDPHRPKDLKAMLDLLDKASRDTLMLQRNASSSGGGSPLHNWLSARLYSFNDDNSKKVVEILELLLSYSKGEELSMINAAGDTPLHSVVASGKFAIAEYLLSYNPNLLYRENATGRTPFELARDMYTALKLKDPPHVGAPMTNHVIYNDSPVHALSDNSPDTFIKKASAKDNRSSEEKIWNLCQDVAQKHPGKRKLISLSEANEVARRLGDMASVDHRCAKRIRLGRRLVRRENEDTEVNNWISGWATTGSAWAKDE